MAWLAPELATGADADPVLEDVVVVATPEPPEVVCTVVPVPVASSGASHATSGGS